MESDLPLEVLGHVLSYLDPLQRLSAGLVCNRWLQATGSLLEDVCLRIKGQPPTLMTSRVFPRIALLSTNINDECVDFINSRGPQLLHLTFLNCSVCTEKKVVTCLHLRTLEANSGDVLLLFTSLPRLQKMNLKHASDLTDDTLMSFDKIASPTLEVFAMPNATVFERLVCKRFYPEGTTHESHPSPYILSRAALEAFVKRRATTLKELSFPCKITPDAAVFLSQLHGLKLLSVSFTGCELLLDVVPDFCRNQPGIVVLNLDNMTLLRDEHVAEICELLPALREFSACYCYRFLDWAVIPLLQLKHLRALCLHECCGLTPVSFFAAIPSTPLLELRKLDLSVTRIEDDHIRDLLSLTPRLVELKLNDCNVSDATLANVICVRLPRLRVLELRGCKEVSDEGLREIRNLTVLVKLDLRFCHNLTNAGIAESIRFRHLKELYLLHCSKVTSCVLAPLRAHNPSLTEMQV